MEKSFCNLFSPSAVHCPLAAAAAAVAASTPAWYVLKPGCAEAAAAVAIAAAAAVVAVDVAMDEDGDLRSGFEIHTLIIETCTNYKLMNNLWS